MAKHETCLSWFYVHTKHWISIRMRLAEPHFQREWKGEKTAQPPQTAIKAKNSETKSTSRLATGNNLPTPPDNRVPYSIDSSTRSSEYFLMASVAIGASRCHRPDRLPIYLWLADKIVLLADTIIKTHMCTNPRKFRTVDVATAETLIATSARFRRSITFAQRFRMIDVSPSIIPVAARTLRRNK